MTALSKVLIGGVGVAALAGMAALEKLSERIGWSVF